MTYVLDTNIILAYIRQSNLTLKIDKEFAPLAESNTPIISVVSVGEIKSLAIQLNWGSKKLEILDELLNEFLIADINIETIIEKYAEIDAFSQNKLPNKALKVSARNMGKNDIWIAATVAVLEAKLLTTDKDFSHLKNELLDLEIINLKYPPNILL